MKLINEVIDRHIASMDFSDFPEDLQEFIWQLIDEAGLSEIPASFPLIALQVAEIQDVVLGSPGDDRDMAYALSLPLGEVPPVLIGAGYLIDGKHRVAKARFTGVSCLPAADLTGIVPDYVLVKNSICALISHGVMDSAVQQYPGQ